MLSPFFWLLDDAGGHVLPLPDVESYGLSPISNSAGAVELKYPTNGLHFENLRAFVDSDRDQRMAVWLHGNEATSLRFYLEDGSGDEVAEDAVWTFTGRFQECRLDDAVTVPSGTGDGSLLFPSSTPGAVMRSLIQTAKTSHGVLTDLAISSFSDATDSNGVAWPTLASLKYSPGVSLLKVAEELAQAGLLEFEVTKDLALRLYVPGTLGTDRTLGPNPLVLQRGRDLREAPRRRNVREAGTDLLMAGANGLYRTVFSSSARARRGRRIMRYRSAGSVTDGGSLQARGAAELARVERGPLEQTLGLVVADGSPIPLVHFGTNDWVLSDVGRGVERLRVRQLTVEGDRDGIEATTSLNDLFAERDEVLARKLAGLESGGTVIGTSEAPTGLDAPDFRAPAAPAGVTVTTAAYVDSDGATWAAAFAAWLPVTTNAPGPATPQAQAAALILARIRSGQPIAEDFTWAGAPALVGTWNDALLSEYDAAGATSAEDFLQAYVTANSEPATPTDDVESYRVQMRYAAGSGLPPGWADVGSPTGTSLDWRSVVAGRGIEVRVAAVDRSGNVSAWSTPALATAAFDTAAPPVPSKPVVTSYLGVLVADWDGRGSAGEGQPRDFSHVEVHVSTSAAFVPNRPADLTTSTTLAGQLRAPGQLPIPVGAYGTRFYVRLVAVDRSGNASGASVVDSAVLVQAADGDIGSVSIGKLTVGIMSAIMTISGIIRTAAAGARVELDTAGLRCIAADGRVLFEFSIPNSLLTVAGRILAGAGIGIGPTVDVNPASASVNLYPNATNARIQLRGTTGTDPNGRAGVAQFQLRTLSTAGAEVGPQLVTTDDNTWLFHRDSSGLVSGAKLFLGAAGEPNGAILAYTDGEAGIDGFVRVFEDGSVTIRSDDLLTMDSDGQILVTGPGDTHLFFQGDGNIAQLRANSNNRVLLGTSGSQLVSNGTVKSFVVDHPTDPDRWLVHGCTESPTAGVEYAGTAVIHDHLAYVELPPYFEALCHEDGRTVHLTPELAVVDGMAAVSTASPTAVQAGGFHIVCPAADGTRVHWLVKATRRGADFDPEPLRSDYSAHGDGPYRYLTPRPDADPRRTS